MYQLYANTEHRFLCDYILYDPNTRRCYGFHEFARLPSVVKRFTKAATWTYFNPSRDPCKFLFEIDPQDCPELHL